MSPEQIQGVTAPDARSDLYSVGVSLYELVTGKRPFDGDSQFAIMSAHLQGTPVPPVTIDPQLPQLLNDVILMLVAKDPNARFQTAGAVRNALSNVAVDVKSAAAPPAVAAVPVGRPAKAVQPGSHRAQWMVLGAVAALLAIVALVAIAPWKGSGAAPAKAAAPAVQPAASEPPVPIAAQPASPEPQPQQPVAVAPAPQVATPAPVSKQADASPRAPARAAGAPKTLPTPQPAAPAPVAAQPLAPAQQPVQQPAAPQPQPAPQQPAAPTGPSRAELQQVRESVALAGVRAAGIRTSLESLQRSQARSGLSLRGDMQSAATLMNTYLDGAEAALNAGDVAQARSFLDKAEPQVQKLEKFLNR
jgi:serine/threonine-protein kinase